MPLDPSEVFAFLPVYNGAVGPSSTHVAFSGKCWDFDITYE